MEHNDPTRREYAPSSYPAQPPQPHSQSNAPLPPANYAASGTLERPRQSPYLPQPPTPSAQGGGRASDAQHMYALSSNAQYGVAPGFQSSAMQYAQEMQPPETQRHNSTHQYPQYGANLMYGMAQAQTPQTAQSPYEQVSQYRARAGTASNTLAAPFGVPQAAQYYLPSQPGPASAPAPGATPPQLPSQNQQQDKYAASSQRASQNAYSSAMMNQPQATGYGGYGNQPQFAEQQQQQPQQQPQQPQQQQPRQPQQAQQAQQAQQQPRPQSQDDQAFERYQAQVRSIFTMAHEGSLREAFTPLLEISYYLLGQAEDLGLTRDDHELHEGRIRLWDEFNRAWLVTLQRQFDMTNEAVQTGRAPREPQSIMDTAALEMLSSELVRLCDGVERHGLVDYQMGAAEDEIVELLLRCLALLDPSEDRCGAEPAEDSTVGAPRNT